MDTIKINKNKTKMIAHRGLSGLEKENTILSFVAAGNRTYYGMECDVYVTLDKKVVIIHDDNTHRVSGTTLKVKESTYNEIKQIKYYDINDSIIKDYYYAPLLKDYLDICEKYDKYAIIEIKGIISDDEVDIILNEINNKNYLDKTILISFHYENLLKVKEKYPSVRLQLLTNRVDEEVLNLCFTHDLGVDARHDLITQDLINSFHKHNLEVNTFTVNTLEEGNKLCEMGIDFITTNILE